MNNRKLISTTLAILLGVAMLALAAPAVADEHLGDGEVEVVLDPVDGETTDEEVQYEVIVNGAEADIGAYEIAIELEEADIGEITDYELTAEDAGEEGPFDNSEIVDGQTLNLEVALGAAVQESGTIATFTVDPVGEIDEETAITVDAIEDFAVAEPEVGEGEDPPAEDFYDAVNLPFEGSFAVVEEPEVIVSLADGVASPGGEVSLAYDLVATEELDNQFAPDEAEIRGIEVDIGVDTSVAEFTGAELFNEDRINDDFTEIVVSEDGSEINIAITYSEDDEGNYLPEEPTEVLELADVNLDIQPDADIGATSDLTFLDTEVLDPDVLEYAADAPPATVESNFEMDLTFNDQDFDGDLEDEEVTVEVEDIDTGDSEDTTLIVTYEGEEGLVIAGLAEAVDGSVDVEVEDLDGFAENEEGVPEGDHTAHLIPTSELSADYGIGEIVSGETAEGILAQDTATITEPTIPELDGLDIVIEEGLTIGDDYPINQGALFADGDSIYQESGLTLPDGVEDEDQRLAPIAEGQHVGIVGLPAQVEPYEYLADEGLLGFSTAEQTVSISFEETEDGPVTLDFGEAAGHGLAIETAEVADFENIEDFEVELDEDNSEFVISDFDGVTGSPTIQFELEFTAADATEGLDVGEDESIDYETDHRLIAASDGDQVRDNFVTFEVGSLGLSPEDAGTEFDVRQGALVTLDAGELDADIGIFESAVSDGEVVLGDERTAGVADDTAPGQVANVDTGELEPGDYFVVFGDEGEVDDPTEDAVLLDVDPLDLAADPADTIPLAEADEPFEIPVTSEASLGEDIEVWFHEETDEGEFSGAIGNVVHVEREDLTGQGNRVVEIVPSVDLAGPGNYTVTVLHSDSGVTVQEEVTFEDAPEVVDDAADDVEIVSPSLFDPEVPGLFDRGDIIPIELELEGGAVATVTFGDIDAQNVEVSATVLDPTFDEEDEVTTVQFYLNTYQIGDESREHGFFTSPHDGVPTEIDNVSANDEMLIDGGSGDGAVLSPGEVDEDGNYPGLRYDLHATGGDTPYTEFRVDEGQFDPDIRDDVNALDIEQRSTDSFDFWKAPGEGENALSGFLDDETTVEDILGEDGLVDEGILTPIETETVTEVAEEDLTLGPAGQFVPVDSDRALTDADGDLLAGVVVEEGEEYPRTVFQDFIAEGDAVVVQAQSTGIEGVLHEAVLRADFDDETSILNRTQNDLVTEEFVEATTGEDALITYDLFAAETDSTWNERFGLPEDADPNDELEEVLNVDFPLSFTPDVDEVVAGQNEDGNLAEFFVAYEEFDENVFPAGDADELDDLETADSLNFAAQAELEPLGGTQDNIPETVNPALDENSLQDVTVEELDHVQRTINIDDVHTFDGQLEVPGEPDYTITGTSTAAPGTLIDMRVISDAGEGTPFSQEEAGIPTVAADEPGEPATFAQEFDFEETRDNVTIQAGTEFTAQLDLTGTALNIVSLEGEVLADPAIDTFEFNNQRGDGDVARIANFTTGADGPGDASRLAEIRIEDEDGNVLGETGVLDRGVNADFNIPLDPTLNENEELTAIATIVQPEVGEVLAERTATINVEDESDPFFDVRNLQPATATVTEGDVIPEISAEVVNIGDIEDNQEITLEVGGNEIDSQELTLGGEESADVVFEDVDTGALDVGSFTHAIVSEDDDATGSLTVQAADEPADFQIISLSPQDTTVTQGDTVVVDVTIQNVGDEDGTQTVELDINGIEDSQDLTLAGGEAGSVSFTVDTDDVEPGDYTHTVSTDDDTASGSLTIEEEDDDDDADDDGAGFGIAVAALALLGAALLAMRRQVE